jgi:hypothetical protein
MRSEVLFTDAFKKRYKLILRYVANVPGRLFGIGHSCKGTKPLASNDIPGNIESNLSGISSQLSIKKAGIKPAFRK